MQSTRQSNTSPEQTIEQSTANKWLKELAATPLNKDAVDAANSLLKVIEEDTRLMTEYIVPALAQQNAVRQARIKLLQQCETVKNSIAAFQEQMLSFLEKYPETVKKFDPKDIEAIKAGIVAVDNELQTLDADKRNYTTKNTSHSKLNRVDVGLEFRKLHLALLPASHKLIEAIQTKRVFRTDKAAKAIQTKMQAIYTEQAKEIPQHIEDYNNSILSVKGYSDAIAAYNEAQKKAAEGFNDLPFVQIIKKEMAAEQPRPSAPVSANSSSATNPNRLLSPKGHQAPQAAKIDQNKLGAAPGRGLS